MKRTLTKLLALLVSVAVFSVAGLSSAQTPSRSASRAPATSSQVAPAIFGHVHGTTRAGAVLNGKFIPKKFVKRPHRISAVGRVVGTLTRVNGNKVHVNHRVRMPVSKTDFIGKRVGSVAPLTAGDAAQAHRAGSCQIVNLVLGPVNLNLLGLVVHLNRVHLNITAQTGPGNLLGNLLCAVAHLLDGVPVSGLLARITNLLNRILGALG
jgi:hypothetical protein